MPQPSIKEVLVHTKEVLIKDGWIQNDLITNEGYCLLGALAKSSNELGMEKGSQVGCQPPATSFLLNTISKKDKEYRTIASYNDKPGRTKDEILQLLDETIERVQ